MDRAGHDLLLIEVAGSDAALLQHLEDLRVDATNGVEAHGADEDAVTDGVGGDGGGQLGTAGVAPADEEHLRAGGAAAPLGLGALLEDLGDLALNGDGQEGVDLGLGLGLGDGGVEKLVDGPGVEVLSVAAVQILTDDGVAVAAHDSDAFL